MHQDLIKKLTAPEELSGLLNFALQGLDRLLNNGKFTYGHETTCERWQKYTEVENPVHDFMENCIELRVDAAITEEALYDAYVVYCHVVEKPPISKNKFGRYLEKYPYMGEGRPHVGDKQVEVWKGITLKEGITELLKAEKDRMNEEDAENT